MPTAADASLQRLVAIRRRVAALLSGSGASDHGASSTAAERVGCMAALLADLSATSPDDLASVRDRQRILVAELQRSGIDMPSSLRRFEPDGDYAIQFDEGFEGLIGAGFLRGVRARACDEISVTGVAGVPLTAEAVVVVAESVLTSVRQRPERPVLVALDEGEPGVGMDESHPLSEYRGHLARVFAWARSQAVAVNLWLCGGASAASYVACAASASHVVAFPNAVLRLDGMEQSANGNEATRRQWLSLGVVDEVAVADRRVGIAWNVSA